jgi:hypothetical protein
VAARILACYSRSSGASHSVAAEEPSIVADLIAEFLADLR